MEKAKKGMFTGETQEERDTHALRTASEVARIVADGHYTLLKFTSNYRFCFGTIDYDPDYLKFRKIIDNMSEGKTIEEAVYKAIKASRKL
jgi:hypothetical protein